MEERVSFEVAMLAKKVNFNKPCTHIYEKDEEALEKVLKEVLKYTQE